MSVKLFFIVYVNFLLLHCVWSILVKKDFFLLSLNLLVKIQKEKEKKDVIQSLLQFYRRNTTLKER